MVLDVLLGLGAWISTFVYMRSGFYFWFWGVFIWFNIAYGLNALPMFERQNEWCIEEFMPNYILAHTLKLKCLRSDSICCCTRIRDTYSTISDDGVQPPKKYIIQWRAWRLWSIILMALIPWMRALALYCDTNGLSCFSANNPVGSSSCTRDPISGDTRYGIYNPNGFFPVANTDMQVFEPTRAYVFCAMYQRWAPAELDTPFILGFTENEVESCTATQGSPFYISLNPSLSECAFPNPAIGIAPGLQGVQVGSLNTSWEFCPGTSPLLLTPEAYGKPNVICPENLNYWRKMSGLHTGPSVDYQTACPPYNANAPQNVFSWFCPGLGAGWLANELYLPEDTIVAFWVVTAYLWFWCAFLEPIIFVVLFWMALTPTSAKKK